MSNSPLKPGELWPLGRFQSGIDTLLCCWRCSRAERRCGPAEPGIPFAVTRAKERRKSRHWAINQ